MMLQLIFGIALVLLSISLFSISRYLRKNHRGS
jgi:hypothetical protein